MTDKALGAGRPATLNRRRLRRRLSAAVLLLMGLAVAGGLAATLTPAPQVAVADESSSALLRTGKQLFDTSCVTCHGANLQGVPDRGPSLIGVGEAAVYFQVSTGRMPAMRGEAQAPRKDPIFDESQIDALGQPASASAADITALLKKEQPLAQASVDKLKSISVVRCDDAAWRFLGLSLAGYNALISLALAATAAWGASMRTVSSISAPACGIALTRRSRTVADALATSLRK